MAARLLSHALAAEEEPLKSIPVVSAGVAACNGDAASSNAVTAMKKVGLSLAEHTSQPVTDELLRSSLFVLCMTESHRALLTYHFDPLPTPVYLMREFLDAEDPEIPDPYGMDLRSYEICRDSMVEAIPSIISFLKNHLTSKSS